MAKPLAGETDGRELALEAARTALTAGSILRKGHSTPWDMQLRHAGCLSSHWCALEVDGVEGYRKQCVLTLIFLALHREHPVRLLRCVRRPAPEYPGGCCSGGVGKLLAGGVGVVGVVNCGVEVVETGGSVGGSGPDIVETRMSVVRRAIGWTLPETNRPGPGRVSRGPDRGGIGWLEV